MEEKASYIAGQIHAHMCLLRSLIESHPDRDKLLRDFTSQRDIAISLSISSDVADNYLEGLRGEAQSLTHGFAPVDAAKEP